MRKIFDNALKHFTQFKIGVLSAFLIALFFSGLLKYSSQNSLVSQGPAPHRIPFISNMLYGFTNPLCTLVLSVVGIIVVLVTLDVLYSQSAMFDHMNREISVNAKDRGMAPMDAEDAAKFFNVTPLNECKDLIYGYANQAEKLVYTYKALPEYQDIQQGVYVRMYHPLAQHEVLFGMTGQGKTTNYVNVKIIILALQGCSFITTDTSGEIPRDFKNWLEKLGYMVRIINLMDPAHSDGYNVFSQFLNTDEEPEAVARQIADDWVATIIPDRPGEFFSEETKQILTLFLLTLYYDFVPRGIMPSMNHLYTLMHTPKTEIIDRFLSLTPDSPVYAPATDFLNKSITAIDRGLNGIQVMLKALQSPSIREMFSHNDCDLGAPGRRKCAYFIVVSPSDKTLHWAAALVVSNMYHTLERMAYKNISEKQRGLDIPTYFILDEVQSIFHVLAFSEKLNTCRKLCIVFNLIVQDIPGLVNNYGEIVYKSLLSACPTKIMLGTNDPDTLATFCGYCGKELVMTDMHNTIEALGVLELPLGNSRQTETEEDMFPANYLQQLANSKAVITSIGRSMETTLVYCKDLPAYKEVEAAGQYNVYSHVPLWKQKGEPEIVAKMQTYNAYKDASTVLGSAAAKIKNILLSQNPDGTVGTTTSGAATNVAPAPSQKEDKAQSTPQDTQGKSKKNRGQIML